MEGLVHDFGIIAILVIIAFCGKYAVTFVLSIFKPRGGNLTVTHQVKDVEANDAKQAMSKAYNTLSKEQKDQVTKVFMRRNDDE